jgi:hypothetical protein
MGQVYVIRAETLRLVKIGFTNNSLKRRGEMQVGSPDILTLQTVFTTDDPQWWEKTLHERFQHLRSHGEWFRPDDDMEEWLTSLNGVGGPGAELALAVDVATDERLAEAGKSDTAVIRRSGETSARFMARVDRMIRKVTAEHEAGMAHWDALLAAT